MVSTAASKPASRGSTPRTSAMKQLIFQANKNDFRIDWFSGSGAGGQHRNKHQNCCRLTHIPTGITTIGQEERDRVSNRASAFKKMVPLLVRHYLGEERKARYPAPDEVVRTYHEPDNRVVDHASGLQREYGRVVGKRDIEEMIEARRNALANKTPSR